jgi:hypothetical protein
MFRRYDSVSLSVLCRRLCCGEADGERQWEGPALGCEHEVGFVFHILFFWMMDGVS